ncbi:MAG TPA: alanine racemase [candidate division Zixibacteria bacterium]|nr:alanine racemase [candidate division Zixibacteria bacterium]
MTKNVSLCIQQAVDQLRGRTPRLNPVDLRRTVQSFLDRRLQFLSTAAEHGSPLYVIDGEALHERATRFSQVFAHIWPRTELYYALKSNSHPAVLSHLIAAGCGLDVSSGLELRTALELGAERIVFSGPGKRTDELRLALSHRERVTVLIDSFSELEKLGNLAEEAGVDIRAGVRLTTDDNGIWRKFGIPLERLGEFFDKAAEQTHVDLQGIQFHLSWNMDSGPHVLFIARLGAELRRLSPALRKRIKFIDIGGGYWPEEGEWLQTAATPHGQLTAAAGSAPIVYDEHYSNPASTLESFADHIGQALKKQIPADIDCTICFEPGRWICHSGMHILLTVVDRKSSRVVITDGGTNAVGWERFENDYFPVINLSRPSLEEHECLVAGSLCTPHDLWGYGYFGADIRTGDVLLMPNQGAYTYSLRQEFIKPLPTSVELARIEE